MFCRNCGNEMNDDQAVCLKCGVEAGKGNAFCGNCGNPVNPEAAVCSSCGVAIKDEKKDEDAKNEKYLNGQNKTVMAIICFLLGAIGVHNFMLGETKKGIFKIVCVFLCGISEILALIDFVKILMGSYVVDPEKII